MPAEPDRPDAADASPGVTSLDSSPSDEAAQRVRRRDRVRDRVTGTADRMVKTYEGAEERWPPLTLLRAVYERYRQVNAGVLAGHVAFRTFLWLVPVTLLLSAILGLLHAEGLLAGKQLAHLGLSKTMQTSVDSAGEQASGSAGPALFVALWAVVYSANGLLTGLHVTFAQVWGLPRQRLARRASLLGKFVGGFFVVLVGMAVALFVQRASALVTVASAVVLVGVYAAALVGLSWILPRRATRVWDLLPGAVVGGAGLLGVHLVNSLYVPQKAQRASEVYGGLGVALVALASLFLIAEMIILSAVLNAVWFEFAESGAGWLPNLRWRASTEEPSPDDPSPDVDDGGR